MKRYLPIYLLIILSTLYSTHCRAQASSKKGIGIGEQVPDITITNIQNYKSSMAKISDFKGKLLILDFWATWCSPCIAMIPKMDSLQKAFEGKIQFLPVAYESEQIVNPFLEKVQKSRPFNLPDVVGDKLLNTLFPHTYLPHYVWIDGNGIVRAITGMEEVNAATITSLLNGQKITAKVKADSVKKFDYTKPFLVDGNGGDGSKLIYHSAFSGYVEGYPGSSKLGAITNNGRKCTMINSNILWFYEYAYSLGGVMFFNFNRIICEVKNIGRLRSSKRGSDYVEWKRQGNAFCYEISVPPHLTDKFFDIMKEDIRRFFPEYDAKVENRMVKCIALIRTSTEDKLKSRDSTAKGEAIFDAFGGRLRNTYLINFMSRLQVFYQQSSPYPFIDETGYRNKVDIDIHANLQNVHAMNQELEKYGLKFVEMEKELEMLVIRDTVNQKK